jgi:hypothetical protein
MLGGQKSIFPKIWGHFFNRGPKSQHFKTYGAKSAV